MRGIGDRRLGRRGAASFRRRNACRGQPALGKRRTDDCNRSMVLPDHHLNAPLHSVQYSMEVASYFVLTHVFLRHQVDDNSSSYSESPPPVYQPVCTLFRHLSFRQLPNLRARCCAREYFFPGGSNWSPSPYARDSRRPTYGLHQVNSHGVIAVRFRRRLGSSAPSTPVRSGRHRPA